MADIFLYQGEPIQADIKLSDPTVVRGGGGATIISAVGLCECVSTAQAEGQIVIPSVGESTGASTAQATSQWIFEGVGPSTGTATVQATSQTIAQAIGSPAGESTVNAISQAIVEAVGESHGTSTVNGIGYIVRLTISTPIASISEGSGDRLKKYRMHPAAPAIPASMLKRVRALEKKIKRPNVDIEAIIRELEEISARIQEAIELSSSDVAAYTATKDAPGAIAVEKRIGPKSLTVRVATEKARQAAFDRARRIEAEAERVAEAAKEEEFILMAISMYVVAKMFMDESKTEILAETLDRG